MEREVIADFCYQTGPLTQLKRLKDLYKKVRKTFTKHTKGENIIKGHVQIPVYKTLYTSEKGGGILGNFC